MENDQEKLSSEDMVLLEKAKNLIQITTNNAKLAIEEAKNHELQYKVLILQLYVKYGLKSNSIITENGDIHRDGLPQPEQQTKEETK